MRLDLDRVRSAVDHIDPVFLGTPQFVNEPLSDLLGCRLVLKVETLNPVRSFKGRGTETVFARLDSSQRERGVVCASAGNLGQALAYGARSRGVTAVVAVSAAASPMKIERMRALGADVRLVDGEIEAALAVAHDHAAATGAYLVEDSRDIATCEGAATIGLELAGLTRRPDAVLVSLGAGAMATGVGFALASTSPGTATITVQPRQAPAMTMSYRAGAVVDAGPPTTIADGVAGRYVIPEVLDDLREVVADAVLVEEASIIAGMRLLHEHAGLVVEPAAALGVAAILEDPERFRGLTVATILCGGNVAPDAFARWVSAP